MFNDKMSYPFRTWGEQLEEAEKMSLSRELAKNTGYPVDSLPPVLRDVITALCRDISAPIELITGTVLSAVSLACQAFIEIQFPDGRIKPCSLYNLVIADSGERKSTIYSLVMKPFLEFEKTEKKNYSDALLIHNAQMLMWNATNKSVLRKLTQKIGDGEDCQSEQDELKKLALNQPLPPKKIKLIYTDTTPEAMQRGLYDNIPTAGLMSDEASVFFEGRAKNNLGFLNELWDGAPVDIERRSQKSFSIDDAHFTMLLMVQYDVFIQYFKKHGRKAAGSGFLSRFLISFIPSSVTPRLSSSNIANSKELVCFHEQINILLLNLKEQLQKGSKPKTLKLTTNAQTELEAFYRKIEDEISTHPKNNAIKALLMKLAENALRLAGLLHYFQYRDENEISRDTLLCAIYFAGIYGNQAMILFSTELATPEQDAEYVYNWLKRELSNMKNIGGIFANMPDDLDDATENNQNEIPEIDFVIKSHMRRSISSSHLRNNGRLNAALKFLEEEDRIWIDRQRNTDGSVTEKIYLKQ